MTAASCGISLGNDNCYVAAGRGGGIEILLNEYSQRSTPAVVSFGDQQRLIGVAATQNQLMNLQNTIYNLMRLIGRQYNDYVQHDDSNLPFHIEEAPGGQIAVCVRHNGQERKFTTIQIMGMLLTKLREIASNATDCVLNCPNFYTDSQRRALIEAARIAGLNPLQLIPDMTSVALYYAYYRTSKDDQDHKIIAFINVGQSSTQTSVVWFDTKKELVRVLAADYEDNLGGRNLDEILAKHFVQTHNLKLSRKSQFRLLAECQKLKKLLSANSNEIPINIECLESDDKDFSARIDRNTFEELAGDIFSQLEACFVRTLQTAQANFEQYKQQSGQSGKLVELMFKIQDVEIVGGSSRVPAIKRTIQKVFGHEASTTLNTDEAVARGCVLQCAALHPVFKVKREIKISDYNPYTINLKYWFPSESSGEEQILQIPSVFPKGHPMPFTRQITLTCQSLPLVVELEYVTPNTETASICQLKVKAADGFDLEQSTKKLKLRVRLDPSGLVGLEEASVKVMATILEDVEVPMEVDEVVDQQQDQASGKPHDLAAGKPQDQAADKAQDQDAVDKSQDQAADKPQDQAAPKPTKTVKKEKVISKNISMVIETAWVRGFFTHNEAMELRDVELSLIANDSEWKGKMDARNSLEEFIYDWRSKLESAEYDHLMRVELKSKFLQDITAIENWLYEGEGEDESKSVYDSKLSSLKKQYLLPPAPPKPKEPEPAATQPESANGGDSNNTTKQEE